MTELAHSKTGIDIHPGATIGAGFFIDHGTGVVIGETCDHRQERQALPGRDARGALVPAGHQRAACRAATKRHPTLEDDVVVYASATILGGDTRVGEGAVIGGNTWVVESVPPGEKVLFARTSPAQQRRSSSGYGLGDGNPKSSTRRTGRWEESTTASSTRSDGRPWCARPT